VEAEEQNVDVLPSKQENAIRAENFRIVDIEIKD